MVDKMWNEKDLWSAIELKLIEIFQNASKKCNEKKLINNENYEKYLRSSKHEKDASIRK